MSTEVNNQQPVQEEIKTISNQEQLEISLLAYFQKVFTRQGLLSNAYYVFRMNNKMEIQLNNVFQDRGVKQISTDRKAVISALQKCPLVEYDDAGEFIVPKIQPLMTRVVFSGIKKDQTEDFQKHLQSIDETLFKNKSLSAIEASSENPVLVINFDTEASAQSAIEKLKSSQFQEKPIAATLEIENVYQTFMQNIQEQKKKSQGPEKPKPENKKQDIPNRNLNMGITPLFLPLNIFYPPQQYPQVEIFGEFSDLFIRRAHDDSQKPTANKQPPTNPSETRRQQGGFQSNPYPQQQTPFGGAYNDPSLILQAQQILLMQHMALQNQQIQQLQETSQQLVEQNQDRNNNQQSGRRNNHGRNRRNNYNNNIRNTGEQVPPRGKNQRRGGRGHQEEVYQKKNVQGNNNNQTSQNPDQKQRNTKNLSVRQNRLRLESLDFPMLDQDLEDAQKVAEEVIVKKKVDPKKTTFEHTYDRQHLLDFFEQFKQQQHAMPSSLVDFQKILPVVYSEAVYQLEIQKPTRKNSSMTPLLKAIQPFRKGSVNKTQPQYRKKTPPKQPTTPNMSATNNRSSSTNVNPTIPKEPAQYRKKTPQKNKN